MHLSRRHLLSAAFGTPAFSLLAAKPKREPLALAEILRTPDRVTAFAESGTIALSRDGELWAAQDVSLRTHSVPAGGKTSVQVFVKASRTPLLRLRLRWLGKTSPGLLYLGDHWERSYGDLGWRGLDPERVLPWYLLANNGSSTRAIGVKTGCGAFCYWLVDDAGVTVVLDVRNGGRGVLLGDRELLAAELVSEHYADQSAFSAAQRFCRRMCDTPRLPSAPVYGGNNWYYAYGKSSADDIRSDSERVSSWAPSGSNRPFMVIDDGWEPGVLAGPWDRGNERFPDMPGLAADMRKIGVRPGIWVRPLLTREPVPDGWKLNSPGAHRESGERHAFTLDPTVPEVVEKVQNDIRRLAGWGYDLIKHDFSTYDLLGRWGFAMGAELTDNAWQFADRSRTNAEITSSFYKSLRNAAGSALLLGCNTVGHLGAGIFEIQRTGDDTSGREWARTRKMGINTLAFRAPQHDAFFAVDADCVGLTREVPWADNRQWLDLLARSGTPLFVSAAPNAIGPEQQQALREAFQQAAVRQPLGEPLDWMETTEPASWKLGGKKTSYQWFLD